MGLNMAMLKNLYMDLNMAMLKNLYMDLNMNHNQCDRYEPKYEL